MDNRETKREIPKSIVVILLVLTVIISILGTWTVLDELERAKMAPTVPSNGVGHVRFRIINPGQIITDNPVSLQKGKVSMRILEAE